MIWLTSYTKEIAELNAGGDATEYSYRTPIENMLQSAAGEIGVAVDILQEPGRIQNSGRPDFRINAKSGGVIGYIECKVPGANLQKITTKSQLEKYRTLSGNIILTDSLHWLLLRDGKKIDEVRLTEKPNKQTQKEFVNLLRGFIETEVEKIGDAKRLAEVLARRCAMLREGLVAHENDDPEKSRLHGLLQALQKIISTEMDFANFADAFAQTLVYSMLLAKLKAPPGANLTLSTLNDYIPANFAAIRDIALFVPTLNDTEYADIRWLTEDILAVINDLDAAAVSESMSYRQDKAFNDDDDPYIYFYENFLAAYDATQRARRGVYYTPPPVVKFIVRAIDDLLRRDFDLPNGLAESGGVTALDFAAGTGTFMLEMMRSVLEGAPQARRNMLTHGHILKNFYGFELLMAPYAIAHLKLSQFLTDSGVPLKSGERINIFLTNTLEKISEQIDLPMLPKLAEEANHAQKVKDSPVLVITGNPPYSAVSQNRSAEQFFREHKKIKNKKVKDTRHTWIGNLIEDYKKVNGVPMGEKNSKMLQDDYVKFIRFAQWKMENVDRGVIAIITNHSLLDNLTFRGMRKNLMDAFDTLYFLDLHGSSKKEEFAPDDCNDENVFDIMQGVAISILIKNPKAKEKGIFHADLYGTRADKYKFLAENDRSKMDWGEINPRAPHYFFIPRDNKSEAQYEKFFSIPEIFQLNSTGVKTHRDAFAFSFDKKIIVARTNDMADTELSDVEFQSKHEVRETRDWKLAKARTQIQSIENREANIRECLYRPFDNRWCFYGYETMDLPRSEVMQHMLAGENLALATVRQARSSNAWRHVCVATGLVECCYISNKSGEVNYLYPLYRYDKEAGKIVRRENIHPNFRKWIDNHYGVAHTPEDILGCIYAILHSPAYRKDYADFLRTDFPRIPFPGQNDEFKRLSTIGNRLINAHLPRKNCTGKLGELNGEGDSHLVEKIRYDQATERLYFNANEYLAPIPPQVFNFQIGGYQPLDKYLKSRKNRQLNLSDTETLSKTANAIAFTIAQMKEIDKL